MDFIVAMSLGLEFPVMADQVEEPIQLTFPKLHF